MSLSHDQYLKYLDENVLCDTSEFHAKGNYTIHPLCRHMSTLHHLPDEDLQTLSGNELRLNLFKRTLEGPQSSIEPLPVSNPLLRNDSCEHFPDRTLTFDGLKRLLAPLIVKQKTGYKRGYPSGGALYPVELFCCNLRASKSDWPCSADILNLLPETCSFEVLPTYGQNDLIRRAINPYLMSLGRPSWALIYVMFLPKTLFKYRYRGYRLALIETGEMAMLTDLRCKELNLNTRLWSGFTDHEVTQGLGLNPALFFPACVQLIG